MTLTHIHRFLSVTNEIHYVIRSRFRRLCWVVGRRPTASLRAAVTPQAEARGIMPLGYYVGDYAVRVLFREGVEEGFDGGGDVGGVGGERFDEFRTDDGAGGIGLGIGERASVGDTEAYQPFVVEFHGVDASEVVELGGAEAVAGAGGGGRRYHVDEAVAMLVDEVDTFFRCFGRDKHYHGDVELAAEVAELAQVDVEGEVGDNDGVDAGVGGRLKEVADAHAHHGVDVAHQHQRRVGHLRPDNLDVGEQTAQRHAVAQGYGRAFLNDGAVGHRVGERHAHFYHVYAVGHQGGNDFAHGV